MLIYNYARAQWSNLKAPAGSKLMPVPRSHHVSVGYNGSMYVYGGKDADGKNLADIWCFDA